MLTVVNNETRKIIELSKEDQKYIEQIHDGLGGFPNSLDVQGNVLNTFLLVYESSPGNLDEFYYFFTESGGPKVMDPSHLEFFEKFFN